MLRLRCIAAVAAVLAVVTAAPPARAALWKYVDERGTAHFVPERAQIPPGSVTRLTSWGCGQKVAVAAFR